MKAVRDAQPAVNLLHRLGFGIHPDKVQVNPTQSIEVLGTQVNSVNIKLLVPHRSLLRKCFDTIMLHKQHKLTDRKYASLIGTLTAVRRVVISTPSHIWPLLHLQKSCLSRVKDWDRQVHLTLV